MLQRISLSSSPLPPLLNLPDDVLITIALLLPIQDILSLKQTCRVLHAFGTTDYLWHRLIEDFGLPLDIPQNVAPNNLSADEAQEAAIKAMRLELNWRKPVSSIKASAKVQGMTQEQCVHMQFLPGGKWLLTVERYHRLLMTRFTTRMSIWSMADLAHPYRVLNVELKGTCRATAFCPLKGGSSAILAVGLHETHGDVVEVRTISLDQEWDAFVPYPTMSFTAPTPKRLLLPEHPVPGNKVIQAISIMENTLIVSVAICGSHADVSSHILLATVDSGPLKWVDPKYTHNINLLQARIHKGYLYLFGQNVNTTEVYVYPLPARFRSKRSAFSSIHNGGNDTNFIDLGDCLAKYEHTLPRGLRSLSDFLHVPLTFTSSIPVVMFNVADVRTGGSRSRFVGYIIHFPVYSRGLPPKIHSPASSRILCSEDTSQQFVQLGDTGCRMVWLEHDLESGRNRILKFETGGMERGRSQILHGLLLPPQPDLPFVLSACNALAFDEITGRLCLAFYDGSLHALDFA